MIKNDILTHDELHEILRQHLFEYYIPALMEMYSLGLVTSDTVSSHTIDSFVESKKNEEN